MKLPQAPLRTGYITFAGGLDTETPAIATSPGSVQDSINVYQGARGGYVVTRGYERFDGRPAPHLAIYSTLTVDDGSAFTVGQTVTTATASGVIVAIADDSLHLAKVSGTFASGDTLLVGGVATGTATADIVAGFGEKGALTEYYGALAADAYRADIAAPPGAGASRGGFEFDGVVYTFRNAADGLSAKMWKSTSSGWSQVSLGREITFTSGGTTEPLEGQTVTGATSAATGVVGRVIVTSGTWAGGDAAGRLVLTAQTGTFQSENLNIGVSLNVASVAGDSAAIALSPGGSYRFLVTNFTADPATRRVYGVDGVNKGFEFDGTVFVQINTGMATDAPDDLCEFVGHLCFAFNGSFQNSSLGDPYTWVPVLGASEIGLADPITGFKVMPGSDGSPVLAIFSKDSIHLLYGSSRDDWKLIPFKYEAGALARSVQQIGQTFLLDTRGVTSLQASDMFGNFEFSTVSDKVKSWLESRKGGLADSCVSRPNNQYRLYFTNGEALYCTVAVQNNSAAIVAMMPMLFPVQFRWVWSSEDANGNESVYCGDSTGMVYQLDVGKSFDGQPLQWSVTLHPVHFKTPNTFKKWRRCTFEVRGDGYAEYWSTYVLGYGSTDIAQPDASEFEVLSGVDRLDDSYLDEGYLDGNPLSSVSYPMYGNAQNMALSFGGESAYSGQLTFNGALIQYSIAREIR
jgi:hypothetical protein